MNARLYAKTGKAPKTALRGQAARVFAEMSATPELATVINERIVKSATPFVTRQDPYRVTLYYILVFKSAGLVAAHENIVAEVVDEAVSETMSDAPDGTEGDDSDGDDLDDLDEATK